MRKELNPITVALLILSIALISIDTSYSKDDFYTKTAVDKISEESSEYLKEIVDESKDNPEKSIPREFICKTKCYVVIPSIEVVNTRKHYAGEGLLSCHKQDSNELGPPIFYNITDIKSFYESEGGLIILVMNKDGMNSILRDQMELSSNKASKDKTGLKNDDRYLTSFITYSKLKDRPIEGFDLMGSTLIYDSVKTFKAYDDRFTPNEILFRDVPIPPRLADFNNLLTEWEKICK